MSDLWWPGDERAGDAFTDASFVAALLDVEQAWLAVLVEAGVAPPDADAPLHAGAPESLARLTEATGSPVAGLLELIRDHTDLGDETRRWLHRGLTSQDVVDSALMLMAAAARDEIAGELRHQVGALADLAEAHRRTPMVARTLTQHALPTTFGTKVAHWLTGLLDAYDGLVALRFPVQLGGAAGTMAAAVELGLDPAQARAALAERLGLTDAPAWHTTRTPVTALGDALVRSTDAWGHLAGDVLLLGRPEIADLTETSGGGSSTMPGKANPVLAVLVRRAALTTPQLAATLHVAASLQVDERADGAWHAEWPTLRDLVRRAVATAGQVTELVSRLDVHPDRMAATLAAAGDGVRAEQRVMADLAGHPPEGDYLGETEDVIDAALARATTTLEDNR